ncbi:MAG: TULIP family P47-like protein [Saprospiraceae bacterium]|nr:TULIP family P47-like protein [Saprospiraceae bacterium]
MEELEEKEEKKMSAKQAERGKETLFRVTYNHQSKLVQIADYKANMIISVSTMVISAIVAVIGYGSVSGAITSYGLTFIIPIVIIVIASLISLVFAIQAARPKLIKSTKWEESGQKSSLLFFGVIAGFSQQAYLEKMKALLAAGDEMYEHMTIDIYYQGLILKRKYNLLVFAYQVLMYGFVLSVLIFLCFFIFSN